MKQAVDILEEETQSIIEKEIRTEQVPTIANDGTPCFGFVYFGIVGLLCFNLLLQVIAYLHSSLGGDF